MIAYKLCVFLGHNLYEYIAADFDTIKKSTTASARVDFYDYADIPALLKLYDKIKDSYDAFIVDSILPYKTLLDSSPEDVILESIVVPFESIYRDIILCINDTPGLTLDDIGMDYLLFGVDLSEAVHQNSLRDHVDRYIDLVLSSDYKQTKSIAEKCFNMHVNDWLTGRKRLFFTRSESCVTYFKRNGIPYKLIAPSHFEISSAINETLQKIKRKEITNDYTVEIQFALRSRESFSEKQIDLISACIQKINHSRFTNFTVHKSSKGLYVSTNYLMLKEITSNLRFCPFLAHLDEPSRREIVIGYGSGSSQFTAHANAVDSCIYALEDTSKEVRSYFTSAENELYELFPSPTEKKNETNASIDISQIRPIAKKVRLSVTAIINIISCMKHYNTNLLTSSMLSTDLKIAPRTANKYLLRLCENNMASIVGNKNAGGKGRPITVYEILLPWTAK